MEMHINYNHFLYSELLIFTPFPIPFPLLDEVVYEHERIIHEPLQGVSRINHGCDAQRIATHLLSIMCFHPKFSQK